VGSGTIGPPKERRNMVLSDRTIKIRGSLGTCWTPSGRMWTLSPILHARARSADDDTVQCSASFIIAASAAIARAS
jgi:hypothetical protein